MGFKTFFSKHCCTWSTKQFPVAVGGGRPEKQKRCTKFVESKIFMPDYGPFSRNLVISPATFHLPHDTVIMKTKDGLHLFGYLLLQIDSPYNLLPTIIFFHGNGGNIGDCLQLVERLYKDINCNILAVEYRGFGLSEGVASEEGVYLDSQAAFDFVDLRPDLDSSQIVLFGISLGGAVAIDLATRHVYKDRIAAIIVENTFASLDTLVVSKVPKCCRPAFSLFPLSTKFSNATKISEVKCPTLLVSGLKDRVIPPHHMTQLFEGSRAVQKKILRFPEGEHLNTWSLPGYTQQVTQFIMEALKRFPISNQINNNHDSDTH